MFAILRDWTTPANRLKAAASRGRPTGLLRGAWLADLAALRKCITLCAACQPKWSPAAHKYHRCNVGPSRTANGECDGCGTFDSCAVYMPQETH